MHVLCVGALKRNLLCSGATKQQGDSLGVSVMLLVLLVFMEAITLYVAV